MGNGWSFSDLNICISDSFGEVILTEDVSISGSSDRIRFKNGIKINKNNLVIDGNNKIIDAKGKSRIFNVKAENVTIRNLTFKNGKADYGGAIRNEGQLTLENCIFIDNTVNTNGNDISTGPNSLLKLVNCTFLEEDSSKYAIWNYNGTIQSMSDEIENYKKLISNAEIETINRDIYICYSDEDQKIAEEIVAVLEYNDMSCWLKSRDGISNDKICIFQEAVKAIENSTMVVLVYSNNLTKEDKKVLIYAEKRLYRFRFNRKLIAIIIDESNWLGVFRFLGMSGHHVRSYDNTNGYYSLVKAVALLLGKTTKPKTKFFNDSVTEVNNITTSKSNSNFKFLNDLVHNGIKEIILDNDIILDEDDLSEYIKLDVDDIVIDGKGHCIDAKRKHGIFFVSGKNITLKNLTLKNSYENRHSGGAIQNYGGEIKLENVNIEDNFTKFNGGAIYNYNGKMEIIDSFLTNNHSEGDGGVIYNETGEIRIIKSDLSKNNYENSECNLITINSGLVKLINSTFSENHIINDIISNNDSLTIEDTSFKDNHSRNIIFNNPQSSLTINGGTFSLNKIQNSSIHNNGKYCSINKTKFKDNSSKTNFSSNIFNESDLILEKIIISDSSKSILNNSNIIIKNSSEDIEEKIKNQRKGKIKTNNIPNYKTFDFTCLDNLIHNTKNNKIILNHDICLEEYELDYYEGGIDLDVDNLVIDGKGHTINGLNKSRIFIITGKNITLKNIIFENGSITENHESPYNNYGGAIKNNSKSKLNIVKCTFKNNKSEKEGGVIFNRGNILIKKSTLENNSSYMGAGVIYNLMGKIKMIHCLFNDNYVNNPNLNNKFQLDNICYGGVINNQKQGIIYLNSCKIFNNKLDGFRAYGGALYNRGVLSIHNSILSDNQTQRNGGMLYNEEGNVKIRKSTISNNIALTGDGGAVYNRYGTIKIINSKLTNNNANYDGGCVHNNNEFTIINTDICNNSVNNRNGGGIYNKKNLIIKKSHLNKNNAINKGGAIYNNENGKLRIIDCKIKNNTAKTSENVHSVFDESLTIDDCVFE